MKGKYDGKGNCVLFTHFVFVAESMLRNPLQWRIPIRDTCGNLTGEEVSRGEDRRNRTMARRRCFELNKLRRYAEKRNIRFKEYKDMSLRNVDRGVR